MYEGTCAPLVPTGCVLQWKMSRSEAFTATACNEMSSYRPCKYRVTIQRLGDCLVLSPSSTLKRRGDCRYIQTLRRDILAPFSGAVDGTGPNYLATAPEMLKLHPAHLHRRNSLINVKGWKILGLFNATFLTERVIPYRYMGAVSRAWDRILRPF